MNGIVHSLLITGGDTNRRNYRSRHKNATAEDTRDELHKVANAARALYDALDTLHGPAAMAIHNLDEVMMQARVLAIAADFQADQEYAPFADQSPSPKEDLAYIAACVFAQVTGMKPAISNKEVQVNTRLNAQQAGGLFLKFLDQVFSARGVTTSRQSAAIAAVALWKQLVEQPS